MRARRLVCVVTALAAAVTSACGPNGGHTRTEVIGAGAEEVTGSEEASPSLASETPPGFDGIWPGTRAELDELQSAFDEGHQPWRGDPVATAMEYLTSRRLPDPVAGEYTPRGGLTGEVRFTAGVEGSVILRTLVPGSLPYVVRMDSRRLDVMQVERDGDEVRVQAYSRAPGTLQSRIGRSGPTGTWNSRPPPTWGR